MAALSTHSVRSYVDNTIGVPVPRPYIAGVIDILMQLFVTGMCVRVLTLRAEKIKDWRKVPIMAWVVLIIHFETIIFVVAASITQFSGWDLVTNQSACDAATIVCLFGYATNKCVYIFLAERAHVIRTEHTPRFKSKLYIFNILFLLVFPILCVTELFFRFSVLKDEQCYIGIEKRILIAPIVSEVVINCYFTFLFAVPLAKIYGLRNQHRRGALSFGSADVTRTASSLRLQKLLKRASIGSTLTLLTTIANLAALMAMNGESAWLCILTCEIDAITNASVLVWVTSHDNIATKSKKRLKDGSSGQSNGNSTGQSTTGTLSAPPESFKGPGLQTHGLTEAVELV